MLAIAGGKGGCGKTTTALCLAHALAAEGERTLAVDADTATPDLHLVAETPGSPGLGAVTDGRDPDRVAHRVSGTTDARVLPAGDADGTVLGNALARLRSVSGPVLLDCPAGAGRDAVRPLRAATAVLLVTTPTVAAVEDTVKTAAMARELGATPVGVVSVARREDRQPSVGALTDARVREVFDAPLLGRIPAATDRPTASGRVRSSYREVAGELAERNI